MALIRTFDSEELVALARLAARRSYVPVTPLRVWIDDPTSDALPLRFEQDHSDEQPLSDFGFGFGWEPIGSGRPRTSRAPRSSGEEEGRGPETDDSLTGLSAVGAGPAGRAGRARAAQTR